MSASEVQSRLGFRLGSDHVVFQADESVYPLEAVYGASYLFIDRCFIFLSRPGPQLVEIRLTTREPASPESLETLAGEVANELLSQTTRLRLAQGTSKLREYYTAAALRSATSAPSIDDLLAELESEELNEDPLEIMVPWEEKHGTDASGSKGDGEKDGD